MLNDQTILNICFTKKGMLPPKFCGIYTCPGWKRDYISLLKGVYKNNKVHFNQKFIIHHEWASKPWSPSDKTFYFNLIEFVRGNKWRKIYKIIFNEKIKILPHKTPTIVGFP
jgi:hypothetical protein